MSALIAFVLRLLSGGILDKVLAALQAKATSDVERQRIDATVAIEDTYGPDPVLAEPNPTLLPTVHVAEATPWPNGTMSSERPC